MKKRKPEIYKGPTFPELEKEFGKMKPNFKKAIESIMSMCYDILNGGITEETFISNLKLFLEYLEQNKS